MAGPLDYSPVRPPQQLSYGAPLVNFGAFGEIPQAYFQGQQNAYQQRQQDLFKNVQGPIDYSAAIQAMIKAGGAPALQNVAPEVVKAQMAAQILRSLPQQQAPTIGGGEPTVPGQAAASSGGEPAPVTNAPGSSMYAGLPGWQPGERPVYEQPAETGATGPENIRLAEQRPQQPAARQQAPSGLPPDYTMAKANELDRFVRNKNLAAESVASAYPGLAAQFRAEAADAAKTRDHIRETIAKSMELGPEEKVAARAGLTPLEYEQRKGVQAQVIKESGAKYNGINAAHTQYVKDQKPYIELAQGILNDPRMYTGIGAERVLDFNRIKAVYGNQQAAALQEGLSKVTAQSTLATINLQKDQAMEAGSSQNRIFTAQVGLAMKAAAGLENTLTGNRLLVEVQRRSGEMFGEVAKQAREYRKTHNMVLDDGFDTQITDYLTKHPLFTKAELANPALLGAPQVPDAVAARGPKAITEWAHAMNADVVRTHDGRYVHPPGRQQSAPQRPQMQM